MTVDTIDVRERAYISQYSTDVIGLNVVQNGVPVDVDSNSMLITFIREGQTPEDVFSRNATHNDVGDYSTDPTSAETSQPGLYTVRWTYSLGAVPQTFNTYVQVGTANSNYDALAQPMKLIVDSVWMRLSDLYDSPHGGPNLQTYFQTHYDRGRVAQLLRIAVGTLNTAAQPFQSYTIDGDGGASFPTEKWGALLERATYIEVLKHLRRSYVEQPLPNGAVNVTYLDRRDYLDRWGVILDDEAATFKSEMDVFKISNMGLGKPAILVSGGVYGRYGPTRVAGSIAARPRYWTRWY